MIFTAHSLPQRVIDAGDRYADEVAATARGVADRVGLKKYERAYQSAGRTPEPWIGPALDALLDDKSATVRKFLVVPIGFVCDHTEILFDIDVQAARVARELATTLRRTESLNTSPTFIAMLEDLVRAQPMIDVAIVGGGIAGLAAAYELSRRGASFAVLERASRAGGVIVSEDIDGFTIDGGPDALLIQKPDGIALCQELGLGGRLVPTKRPRLAYIQRAGRLHPLPAASVFGIPTAVGPFLRTRLFSLAGQAAHGRRAVRPAAPQTTTTSRSGRSSRGGSAARRQPISPSRCSRASTPAMSIGCRCRRCSHDWSTRSRNTAVCCARFDPAARRSRQAPTARSSRCPAA